jgi:hypothetical protein
MRRLCPSANGNFRADFSKIIAMKTSLLRSGSRSASPEGSWQNEPATLNMSVARKDVRAL